MDETQQENEILELSSRSLLKTSGMERRRVYWRMPAALEGHPEVLEMEPTKADFLPVGSSKQVFLISWKFKTAHALPHGHAGTQAPFISGLPPLPSVESGKEAGEIACGIRGLDGPCLGIHHLHLHVTGQDLATTAVILFQRT